MGKPPSSLIFNRRRANARDVKAVDNKGLATEILKALLSIVGLDMNTLFNDYHNNAGGMPDCTTRRTN